MHTVDDKTVISGLRWYASDQYGLLITVGGVLLVVSVMGVCKYYIGPIGDLSLSTATAAG